MTTVERPDRVETECSECGRRGWVEFNLDPGEFDSHPEQVLHAHGPPCRLPPRMAVPRVKDSKFWPAVIGHTARW